MANYLTEKTLGIFLESTQFFSNQNPNWIHDKIVPNSGINNRPDFRSDNLKLIVEFDGFQHYTQSSYIIKDEIKDSTYSKMGYTIVRIPYFVQLESRTISYLFGFNYEYKQTYPHGFIDKNAILPADFCELGIERFIKDLQRFSFIKTEIIESLIAKSADIRTVIPQSLTSIIYGN